jgi:TRAP transporter TAXI family solute receptor
MLIKRFLIFLIVILIMMPLVTECAPTTKHINMGSASEASSHYIYAIALGELLGEYLDGITVTTIVSGGTHDNIARMKRNEIQMASASSSVGFYEAYNGLGTYKDKEPFTHLRAFPIHAFQLTYIIVREDSGITDIATLNEKPFSSGMGGSSDQVITQAVFELNGCYPKWSPMSTGEAVSAIKDKQVIGYAKGSVGENLDSSMIDLKSTVGIRILSYPQDWVDKAKQDQPWIAWRTVKKGAIEGYNMDKDILAPTFAVCTAVDERAIPQDLGYKMIKAIIENWKDLVAAFPAAGSIDPILDTISTWEVYDKPVPLHSGFVQYCKEKGIEIPAKMIPPEYK